MIHCIPIINKDTKRVCDVLTSIISLYHGIGFKVVTIHGDGEFDSLRNWIMNNLKVQLSVFGSDGHVPLIENAIKFIKERNRCIQRNIPFHTLPKSITFEMVSISVPLINPFNRENGVNTILSAQEIVERRTFVIPLCHFGDLVQTYNTKASNDTFVEREIFCLTM